MYYVAANPRFQIMMNAKDGSYLIKKLSEKLRKNYKDKYLGQISKDYQKNCMKTKRNTNGKCV